MIKDKQIVLDLVVKHNLCGKFVEIGTWTGDFAEALLRSTSGTLTCIDPYKYFEDGSYNDSMNEKMQLNAEERFLDAKNRLEAVGGCSRVQMLRKCSLDAVSDFEDASLDFIYIDGNHTYDYVLQDILAWFPKLRPGGILAGDDIWSTNLDHYTNNKNVRIKFGQTTWGVFGVYPAVLEAQRQLGIQFTIQENQFYYIHTP